jgi:hypothetical protein
LIEKKRYKYPLNLAADMTVAFVDLPELIFKALHQFDEIPLPANFDTYQIKLELMEDIRRGKLGVCCPYTLGAYYPPVSEENINASVLIPEHGFATYIGATKNIQLCINKNGLGPDYWTLENAIADIVKAAEWCDWQEDEFRSELLKDIQSGDVAIYDPETLIKNDQKFNAESDLIGSNDIWDAYCLYAIENHHEEMIRWPATRISERSMPISLMDRKPWVHEGISAQPNLFLYEQAAWEIAETQGWDDGVFQEFLFDMAGAICANEILVYRPNTGVLVLPELLDKWFVTADGVNSWLEKKSHANFRWSRPGTQPRLSTEAISTSMGIVKQKVRRRTWREVAMPYIIEVYKSGQFSKAKDLYRALENKIGTANCPFDKGMGPNAYKLFVREISQPLDLKTLQNAWGEIRTNQ